MDGSDMSLKASIEGDSRPDILLRYHLERLEERMFRVSDVRTLIDHIKPRLDEIRSVASELEQEEIVLACKELERRYERRIPQLIQRGQENGTIAKSGRGRYDNLPSAHTFYPSSSSKVSFQLLASVSDEAFEKALRESNNFSRDSVMRIIERQDRSNEELLEKAQELANKGYNLDQTREELGIGRDRALRLFGTQMFKGGGKATKRLSKVQTKVLQGTGEEIKNSLEIIDLHGFDDADPEVIKQTAEELKEVKKLITSLIRRLERKLT